jgi:hypothetical protein
VRPAHQPALRLPGCGQDADCFSGICQAAQCVAPTNADSTVLAPTGVCAQPVGDTNCTTNAQCGSSELCFQGQCQTIIEQYVPRPFITDNEKAGKRTEYQYSTVMDYGAKINSDVHSLGKYDYAAIKFGYTQLVDTYTDTSRLEERIERGGRALPRQSRADYSFFLNARELADPRHGLLPPVQLPHATTSAWREPQAHTAPLPPGEVPARDGRQRAPRVHRPPVRRGALRLLLGRVPRQHGLLLLRPGHRHG